MKPIYLQNFSRNTIKSQEKYKNIYYNDNNNNK